MENNTRLGASNKKCQGCGGDLIFNPKTRKLNCEKCGSEYDFNMVKRIDKLPYTRGLDNQGLLNAWASEAKILKCDTCGANIELIGREVSKKCPYCESSYVADINAFPCLKPNAVIPFAFDEMGALDAFKQGIKKKFFAPSAFKKRLPKNQIYGVYVPSFNFDMDTRTTYRGVLERKVTVKRGKETVVKYERFNIKGVQDMIHRNFVIESSDNLDDKQVTSLLPYDFDESYEYNENFIRGHSSRYYEDNLDKCHDLAKQKIDENIKQFILRKYDYDRVISFEASTIYSNEKYIYRLLPLYKFEFDYKKKKYIVVMNGQSGKIGKGLPVSPLKVSFVVLLVLILIVLLVILMSMGE